MKIEVRKASVVISGYVNAVERRSPPFFHNFLGKIVEIVKAGVFGKALSTAQNVEVLLNHNEARKLADTASGTAVLKEDNIGLHATVTVTDPEVIEKAREGKLTGWSFGFTANGQEFRDATDIDPITRERTLTDFILHEVSILDDTTRPQYVGTSIEARSADDTMGVEVRYTDETPDVVEVRDEDKPAEGAEDKNPTDKPTKSDDELNAESEEARAIEADRIKRENLVRSAGV